MCSTKDVKNLLFRIISRKSQCSYDCFLHILDKYSSSALTILRSCITIQWWTWYTKLNLVLQHNGKNKQKYLDKTVRASSISCSNLDEGEGSVLPLLKVAAELYSLKCSGIKKPSQWWGLPMLMKVSNIRRTVSCSKVVLKKSFNCFLQARSSEIFKRPILARHSYFKYKVSILHTTTQSHCLWRVIVYLSSTKMFNSRRTMFQHIMPSK